MPNSTKTLKRQAGARGARTNILYNIIGPGGSLDIIAGAFFLGGKGGEDIPQIWNFNPQTHLNSLCSGSATFVSSASLRLPMAAFGCR